MTLVDVGMELEATQKGGEWINQRFILQLFIPSQHLPLDRVRLKLKTASLGPRMISLAIPHRVCSSSICIRGCIHHDASSFSRSRYANNVLPDVPWQIQVYTITAACR